MGRVWLGFHSSWEVQEGGGARSTRGYFRWLDFWRERAHWDLATAVSSSQSRACSRALAGGRKEATRLMGKGRHVGRGAHFSLINVLPLLEDSRLDNVPLFFLLLVLIHWRIP